MPMTCPCSGGEFCELWNRRVRWADVQSCHSNGPQGTPREPQPQPRATISKRSCTDCTHKGEPVLSANGKQVGSEGCGCSGASVASGLLWFTCNLTTKPIRQDRATRCEYYTSEKLI